MMNKHLLRFAALCLLCCLPAAARAQGAYSVTRDIDHTIVFTGKVSVQNVHLFVSYNSTTGAYRIAPGRRSGDSNGHFFMLYEPLNIQFFANNMQQFADTVLNKDAPVAITNASMNEMFLSVYYAKILNEEPVWSGNLIIAPYVQVYDGRKNLSDFDFDAQDITVDSLKGQLQILNSAESSSRGVLDNWIDSELLKAGKVPVTTAMDSTAKILKMLKETFKTVPYAAGTTQIAVAEVPFIEPHRELSELNRLYEQYWVTKEKIRTLKPGIESGLLALGVNPIKKVSLQFERGFLERITVWVIRNGREQIFENAYAIGFSSITNFQAFADIRLYQREEDNHYFIYLSDVFSNYDNILDNFTRDFSPADTAINFFEPTQTLIRLRKESVINLFDSKIYSDLNGLRDNSPNGLVQIEVARRFNLNTKRQAILKGFNGDNSGHLNYLNVWGAITKLEAKGRYLPLRNANVAINDTITSPSYATTLDLFRYETANLGIQVNGLLFDLPNDKLTFYIDPCARYGYTPLLDVSRHVDTPGHVAVGKSAGDSFHLEAHSFTLYPRFSMEVFSQRRVGFQLSYQPQYTWFFTNNNFKNVASYAKSDVTLRPIEPLAHWTNMVELLLRAETGRESGSKIFFRARFYWQMGDANTFFPQFQLGYAYNIFFRK